MNNFIFKEPLIEGVMIKRNSQFTATIQINGETIIAHIPTTNRIGDVENKNLPCLLSYHPEETRKLHYDIEAVLLSDDDNWIGINQILSNKIVEHLLKTHQLDEIVSSNDIHREVKLGNSKLDFKVGNTYLEVKTPLTEIQVKYGKNIKTHPQIPFSSTERMQKHVNELAESLKDNERAIFLEVLQYRITEPKERLHSTHYEEVKKTVEDAYKKGVEFYKIELDFKPDKVSLYKINKTEF